MNCYEKFNQRWEFRRREDGVDSSSDDSESNRSDGPVHKKHKLFPNIILAENEATDTSRSQQTNQLDTNVGAQVQSAKATKKITKPSKKKSAEKNKAKRSSIRENKGRKRNLCTQKMVVLSDFKFFTESLIEELRVAREKMLAEMKDEMRKLVDSSSFSRPGKKKDGSHSQKNEVQLQNGVESGVKSQSCFVGLIGRHEKSTMASDANNFSEAVEEIVNHDQVVAVNTAIEQHKGERLSTKTPITSVENSDQRVFSSNMIFPAIVPKPRLHNHGNNVLSNNHFNLGGSRNRAGTEVEMGKLLNGKNDEAFQPEEQFDGLSHISSKRMGFPGQNCSQTSSLGVGFPVPLHQGPTSSSIISSQIYSANSLQGNSSIHPRTDEEVIGFSLANGHMNYKTDGDVVSMRSQDIGYSQFYLG